MKNLYRKYLPVFAAACVAASATAWAADAPAPTPAPEEGGIFAPKNFTSTFGFTTDYVFRGISQTDSNIAAQGSFDYAHPIGLYLGAWGSNIAFGGNLELDWYGGYRNSILGIAYDVGAIYYSYPKSHDDPEINYFELALKLSYTFKMPYVEPTISFAYNFSPNYAGEDGKAHYVNGKLALALPWWGLGVSGEVGYQKVEGDETTGNGGGLDGDDGFHYVHYRVGVSKADLVGFNLDLSYHNTTESDFLQTYMATKKNPANGRVVFTVSRTF